MDSNAPGLSALEALRAKLAAPVAPEPPLPVQEAESLPEDALVCHCTNVTAGELRHVIHVDGARSLEEVQRRTRAGGSCGKCIPLLTEIVDVELHRSPEH
ncbi:MAG: (2Fe-2S)-binding protein [Cellulomonadaceae bacterium]